MSDKHQRAAFTIVQNEPVFLPLWLDYYARHFDPEDMYVLDHDSTDGSTRNLGGRCHVVPIHKSPCNDHHWLKSTVEMFQAFLLQSYQTVLFAEADEIIVADPSSYVGLGEYIDRMTGPAARCTGLNVIHAEGEPALDFSQPVMAQRGSWFPSPFFDKTLISRVPLKWVTGFHAAENMPDLKPDPALVLVHLHRVDYGTCQARHRTRALQKWNARDVELGLGRHNRIFEDAEFREWFYHGDQLKHAPPVGIPQKWRGVF